MDHIKQLWRHTLNSYDYMSGMKTADRPYNGFEQTWADLHRGKYVFHGFDLSPEDKKILPIEESQNGTAFTIQWPQDQTEQKAVKEKLIALIEKNIPEEKRRERYFALGNQSTSAFMLPRFLESLDVLIQEKAFKSLDGVPEVESGSSNAVIPENTNNNPLENPSSPWFATGYPNDPERKYDWIKNGSSGQLKVTLRYLLCNSQVKDAISERRNTAVVSTNTTTDNSGAQSGLFEIAVAVIHTTTTFNIDQAGQYTVDYQIQQKWFDGIDESFKEKYALVEDLSIEQVTQKFRAKLIALAKSAMSSPGATQEVSDIDSAASLLSTGNAPDIEELTRAFLAAIPEKPTDILANVDNLLNKRQTLIDAIQSSQKNLLSILNPKSDAELIAALNTQHPSRLFEYLMLELNKQKKWWADHPTGQQPNALREIELFTVAISGELLNALKKYNPSFSCLRECKSLTYQVLEQLWTKDTLDFSNELKRIYELPLVQKNFSNTTAAIFRKQIFSLMYLNAQFEPDDDTGAILDVLVNPELSMDLRRVVYEYIFNQMKAIEQKNAILFLMNMHSKGNPSHIRNSQAGTLPEELKMILQKFEQDGWQKLAQDEQKISLKVVAPMSLQEASTAAWLYTKSPLFSWETLLKLVVWLVYMIGSFVSQTASRVLELGKEYQLVFDGKKKMPEGQALMPKEVEMMPIRKIQEDSASTEKNQLQESLSPRNSVSSQHSNSAASEHSTAADSLTADTAQTKPNSSSKKNQL